MNVSRHAAPLASFLADRYRAFLECRGLRDEQDADTIVLMTDDDGSILACGARSGRVIKQLAVSPAAEGEGACAVILSELIEDACKAGHTHLFLCTKPENKSMFQSMGFFPIAQTADALLMENRRNGIDSFLASLPHPDGNAGAVVCNCNPFTLGHRHLIETAAKECDSLHVFVLSETLSAFSPEERLELVKLGTADIPNCFIHQSEDYLVSRATFPAYFIKDSGRADSVRADLDITIFVEKIAPALGISVRFVGEEPFCSVTRAYNERMKELLPAHGIELREIPRYNDISASRVRALMKEKNYEAIKPLVPETTYAAILRYS